MSGMVVLICNPRTQEAEAGGALQVPDQPDGLYTEFQVNQSCTETLSQKQPHGTLVSAVLPIFIVTLVI